MAQHPDAGVYHGKKRPAESDPDGDQPLAKRFGRLHIALNDMMILDDTKHTVYIHDLEREIAETELPNDPITFLPGIGESLRAIPRFVVTEAKPMCNELVLYREPASLTVPKERDTVRKALIETRERARTNQCGRHPSTYSSIYPGTVTDPGNSNNTCHPEDAMEIDAGI
ncbi:hypothetical protein BDV36DRAFT_288335 [Aspergillus pseudocaelatus]|uniref:Fungal-type protein kinase domain-containing protein n=1 Tax=Aspergillus pseudocaelatus TaxID=1825620 RepID=A0ABQ6W418_9EURO|nr:hypothetical protein BDV36DRAFT_288335 [Aspergillus pseudocaelatus]